MERRALLDYSVVKPVRESRIHLEISVHNHQALPKPGDVVGRKYRIVGAIGSGGMGVVFEAIHVDTDGHVALKWLSPELSSSAAAVERFKREARATGRIHHPNVVAIHDIGEHQGSLFLVMELLTGSSLQARLQSGSMSLFETCQIIFPVMRGIAAAHAVKVLHRDIKPDNIFLAESPDGLEPVPKVLDFGIAKLCSDSERTAGLTAHSRMIGTYQYMAIEQLQGQRDLDERVDVYALGTLLYLMLSGRLPFQADNPVDLALKMLQSEARWLSQIDPSLSAQLSQCIARALSRDRAQRYANVDQFALALEPFAGGLRYKGPQQQLGRSLPPPNWRVQDASPTTLPLPTPFAEEDKIATQPVSPRKTGRSAWRLGVAGALAAGAGALWLAVATDSKPLTPPVASTPSDASRARGTARFDSSPDASKAAPLPGALPPNTATAKSHVDEWEEPTPRVQALGDAPAPAGEPGAPSGTPQLSPTRDAGAQDPRAPVATRVPVRGPRASKREQAGAVDRSRAEPPASTRPAPKRPAYGHGALDMTELPAPSWATSPGGEEPPRDQKSSGSSR